MMGTGIQGVQSTFPLQPETLCVILGMGLKLNYLQNVSNISLPSW